VDVGKFAVVLCLFATTLGCSSFQLGGNRQPVTSASRSEIVVSGYGAELEPRLGSLRVRAFHLCDVEERQERSAGYVAERFVASGREDQVRKEREREMARVGPVTPGLIVGEDESGGQHRTLSGDLNRTLSEPWLMAAGAGAVAETLLKAHARVQARISGEHREHARDGRRVKCQRHPARDVEVALDVDQGVHVLGRTDDQGELWSDLGSLEVKQVPENGRVPVLVEGRAVGDVDLHVVARRRLL
jgi:hypothetical protein